MWKEISVVYQFVTFPKFIHSIHGCTRSVRQLGRFNLRCWNILSAYGNFTHRGLNFSSTFSLTINSIEYFSRYRSRLWSTDWEEKRQNRLSFLRHSRWRSFSCDSSGIPGTRLNRFQRWSLSKCIEENGNLFPSSSRNYDSYKRNVISQFSESSYRFFTQIQNTLRHFRCFWNSTRWISMTYHANDIFWRAASMSQNLEKFQNVKFFSSVMKFLIWSTGRLINGLRCERN